MVAAALSRSLRDTAGDSMDAEEEMQGVTGTRQLWKNKSKFQLLPRKTVIRVNVLE